MDTQITETLSQAVQGLLYMSESDEPFGVITWPGDGTPIDPPKLLELTGNSPDASLEMISLDEFFKDLIEEKPWYGEKEKAASEKYRNLQSLLVQELSDIHVFRVGEVEVAIYIIGITRDGNRAGVRTRAVET